jgi:hypothetical protein
MRSAISDQHARLARLVPRTCGAGLIRIARLESHGGAARGDEAASFHDLDDRELTLLAAVFDVRAVSSVLLDDDLASSTTPRDCSSDDRPNDGRSEHDRPLPVRPPDHLVDRFREHVGDESFAKCLRDCPHGSGPSESASATGRHGSSDDCRFRHR